MPRVLLELLWKQLAPLRAVRLWPREHEQIGVGAATTLIVHTGLTDPAKANVACEVREREQSSQAAATACREAAGRNSGCREVMTSIVKQRM